MFDRLIRRALSLALTLLFLAVLLGALRDLVLRSAASRPLGHAAHGHAGADLFKVVVLVAFAAGLVVRAQRALSGQLGRDVLARKERQRLAIRVPADDVPAIPMPEPPADHDPALGDPVEE